MFKLFDRVKFNTSTTGTGDIAIGSVSSSQFYLPSDVGATDGDTVRYIIVDGTDVEEGVGTIADSVATLQRTTVSKSKVSGVAGTSKLSLSGLAVVSLTASGADILVPANNLEDVADADEALSNLGGLAKNANLSDVADAATARDNLGAAAAVTPTYAKVHLSGSAQTVSGITKVAFDAVDINQGTGWDATNHWFKPSLAGTYRITASARVNGTIAQGGGLQVDFSKNGTLGGTGSTVGEFQNTTPVGGGASSSMQITGSTLVAMNGTTDTLEVDVQVGSVTSPALDNSSFRTYFTAEYVGP